MRTQNLNGHEYSTHFSLSQSISLLFGIRQFHCQKDVYGPKKKIKQKKAKVDERKK